MAPPEVITFGCRLNHFESQVIRRNLAAKEPADTIVFNTCAVTAEAERQARQAIRKARRANPECKIIVTGCAAQLDPESFAAMDEVDRVIGNAEKLVPESFGIDPDHRIEVDDIMTLRETAGHLIDGFEGRARAFVQVQNGCDHRCTFCIIPFARGVSRSVPMGAVVRQIRALTEGGFKEVVLTGVDITSYGGDLPAGPSLGTLCRKIIEGVPTLPRLRLSSLDPMDIDDQLLALIGAEPRLMPHLHLSAQAGDDLILKRMKRRHLRGDLVELCANLRRRRPDIALGADLIAGFPTESDAMFERSLALIGDCGLAFLHVFPYSPRPGTPAARMPQVPVSLRKRRAARLRAAGEAERASFFQGLVGTEVSVLVERNREGRAFGHCAHFAPVWLAGEAPSGSLVTARVTAARGDHLLATAV